MLDRKTKIFIFLVPICTILFLIGTSYAFYVWRTSNDEETIIATDTGYAQVLFDGGKDVTGKLKPVSDKSKGMSKQITVSADKVFIEPISFNLYLDINSIDEGLKHESFKFELYKDGSKIKEGNFSDSYLTSVLSDCEKNTGVQHIVLTSDTVTTTEAVYTLYTWIDGTMSNPLSMEGNNFNFTLHADGQHAILGEGNKGGSDETPNLQTGGLAYYLTNTYNNAEKEEVENNEITYYYDRTNRLMADVGGNIRFFGADDRKVSDDLKNYIYFNCSDYSNQSSDTCEIWRIIGAFDGKVKIMRNTPIGGLAWDYDKNNGEGKATHNNDWSNSSLQEFLNGKYYDRGETTTLDYILGNDGKNILSGDSIINLDLERIGIKERTRELISETLWHLRGYDNSTVFSDEMYDYERNSGRVYNSSWPETFIGKIAIPYVSDYGYAVDFTSCDVNLRSYDIELCTSTNWMKSVLIGSNWLMAHDFTLPDHSWYVYGDGYVISYFSTLTPMNVVPVLHLNSELGIKAGDGSQDAPYQLSVN